MVKNRISKKSITSYRIIETLFLILFLFIVNYIFNWSLSTKIIVSFNIMFTYLIIVLWYERERYNSTFYFIDNSYILVEKGVILKSKTIILINSILGVEYSQNIIQRILNLYTAYFYSTGKKLVIMNIDSDGLFILREKLSDKIEI